MRRPPCVPVACVLAAVVVVWSSPAAASETAPVARRVLVLSIPGVTWADVQEADVPVLRDLLEESAVASLAVRITRMKTQAGDGYATLGAGTRAVGPPDIAGFAFERDETHEGGAAAEVFARRRGRDLDGALGHLEMAALEAENDRSLFDGSLGTVGRHLATAGVSRGVVANADRTLAPAADEIYHREAALALIDEQGQVPCGEVGSSLLAPDPTAPFGVRLDADRVAAAFERCFTDRSVVLVEASDLRRAEDYREFAGGPRAELLFRQALERTDALAGRLLEAVDPARDAVVVVAPAAPQAGAPQLTVFAVRAPGLGAGLLESGVTRQAGFVAIVDVGPTVAALAGAPIDDGDIEGRAATLAREGGSAADRFDLLVESNRDAVFRDRMLTSFAAAFIVMQLLLSAAFAWFLWRGRPLPRLLEVGALSLIAVFPLTYWAALLPFPRWGSLAYLAFTLGGGFLLGLAADTARRNPFAPPAILFGGIIATAVVSVVLLGSRLQLSTVFGDSPVVAGRFTGINNVTFAQLMVAAILLAVFICHRYPGRRSLGLAALLLAAVLLVDVAPMWGADVGGILAGLPAVLLTVWLLAGWRLRWRHVLTWGLATVGAVLVLGLLDLSRDASDRSHLGRFFERIGEDGWSGFTTVIGRKLDANLASLTQSVWRFMALPSLLLIAYLLWRAEVQLRQVRERIPELDRGLIGVGTAALLGFALNDSGIAVPGVVLAVLVPCGIYLVARVGRTSEGSWKA